MKQHSIKKMYKAPEIRVAAFSVEKGFAISHITILEPLDDDGLEYLGDGYSQSGGSTEGMGDGFNLTF